MNHPEIFFRTTELALIKSEYYSQKKAIDLEVENYFANTQSLDNLYSKVNELENSKEILKAFQSNIVAIQQFPISSKLNRETTVDPFSYSLFRSFNITDSKSGFNIGIIILVIFLVSLLKNWKAKRIFVILLIASIGWNLYNYYVKEPDFLAQSRHFLDASVYRKSMMQREANEKLEELYQPTYNYQAEKTYEYEVEGTDGYNDYVEGYIETSGKYGAGYLHDNYSNKIKIEVEWISNGELLGKDNDGNEYNLKVKH